jgi:hypothetical protein
MIIKDMKIYPEGSTNKHPGLVPTGNVIFSTQSKKI